MEKFDCTSKPNISETTSNKGIAFLHGSLNRYIAALESKHGSKHPLTGGDTQISTNKRWGIRRKKEGAQVVTDCSPEEMSNGNEKRGRETNERKWYDLGRNFVQKQHALEASGQMTVYRKYQLIEGTNRKDKLTDIESEITESGINGLYEGNSNPNHIIQQICSKNKEKVEHENYYRSKKELAILHQYPIDLKHQDERKHYVRMLRTTAIEKTGTFQHLLILKAKQFCPKSSFVVRINTDDELKNALTYAVIHGNRQHVSRKPPIVA